MKKRDPIARVVRDLERFDFSGQTPVLQDNVARLRDVLEQMVRVRAGEVRIVALGQAASMKSTMLRLLLGSDALRVGPGAVTVAATEMRLVQGTGSGEPPAVRVLTLTEEGARRRARALLGLPQDDPRTLAELASLSHPNQRHVVAMIEAGRMFGYGTPYTLDDYRAKGGALAFDDPGTGTELVARVIVELPVPPEVWNLRWAGNRTVVVVDTPGRRQGSALEDVIIAEMQDRAHIALLAVSVASGGRLAVPEVPPGAYPVLVATKLDHIDNPLNANELETHEGVIASVLRDLGTSGRPARLVAISGPWAAGDQESWARFDPANVGVWHSAELKRDKWREAQRQGGEAGPFREAVFAALDDGGVARLQRVIAELANDDPGRLDEEELDRLLDLGLELVDQALRELPDPGELEALAAKQRERATDDPAPIAALREIAAQISVDQVYGAAAWRSVRQTFQPRQDQWLGPAEEVGAILETVSFAELAGEAAEETKDQLDEALSDWYGEYVRPGLGEPVWRPDEELPAAAGPAVEQFDRLARQLLRRLVLDFDEAMSTGWLTFRKVARIRDELAKLLERLLLALFEDTAVRARNDLIEHFKDFKTEADDSEMAGLLDDIRSDLLKLAGARADRD
ncbi:hypothetical protein AB0K60_01650 [Thermopolyspora sp. NPDC052614]|uniref:hypothetical protein n=1 Tax=Thermopolyspora sp. NPDC052614 TaxID=3155682 RepID=UPI0034199B0C